MTGFVYVLRSGRNGQYYIGSTNNLIQRYRRHAAGQVCATARLRPWVMLGWREYESATAAREAEWGLKQKKNRGDVQRWLAETLA